ncbi:response regulator [Paenibacillus xylanexedens]|uniref:response regulator n=1 Tax=Paenibacillus xylanexedens TaxID=528191 RepID=UPI0011A83EDD|nr:response regulator [Paenibacillus xylanexedens]
MYALLIVDDEKSVVDSLALTIPWEDSGIEEVHRAYSAEEAMDITSRFAIDVMITDIRMPEMDGLELIRLIRLSAPRIRSIILSGHDEFEYAQQAIRYQAMNYMLKPVDTRALVKAVEEAIKNIEQEWENISSMQQIQHMLHANLPVLQNQFLNDLLQNKPMSQHILEERLKILDLPIRMEDNYRMMVIRMEEEFSGYDLQSLSLLEYAITNIADEVFTPFGLWHCITDQGYLVFLIHHEDRKTLNSVDSFAVKLQNHVQKFLKGAISICLGQERLFPEGLSEGFNRCVAVIQQNVGEHKSYFITVDDQLPNPVVDQGYLQLLEPPLLPQLLEAGNWEEAIAKIKRVLSVDGEGSDLSHEVLYTCLLYLSSTFAIVFRSQHVTLDELLNEEFDLMIRKKSQISSHRVYAWAEKIIQFHRSRAINQIRHTHDDIVSSVHAYIQNHLSDGISLQIIADHVGLHPVYLSKVYKTATGETIGDYLFRLRMQRAVHLLTQTDLKVADVSKKLGFMAPPHFIKIFKKQYGCTPQEYRNR